MCEFSKKVSNFALRMVDKDNLKTWSVQNLERQQFCCGLFGEYC